MHISQLWSKANLDLRMNVYACASTGLSDGFLEVVRNAETLSNIALVPFLSNPFFLRMELWSKYSSFIDYKWELIVNLIVFQSKWILKVLEKSAFNSTSILCVVGLLGIPCHNNSIASSQVMRRVKYVFYVNSLQLVYVVGLIGFPCHNNSVAAPRFMRRVTLSSNVINVSIVFHSGLQQMLQTDMLSISVQIDNYDLSYPYKLCEIIYQFIEPSNYT